MLTFDQITALFAATNGAQAAAGIVITACFLLFLTSRMNRMALAHQQALTQQATEHQQAVARMQTAHEQETAQLWRDVAALRTQVRIMAGVLEAHNLISPVEAGNMATDSTDPLLQALVERFDLDDLILLASDLGMSADHLRNMPRANAALELKAYAERTTKRARLVAAMQTARPGLLEGLR